MSDLLEVGRVVKPHGLRGEVVVRLVTDVGSRLDAGAVLDTPAGPLEVIASRPHQGCFIVAFSGVHDRNEAERLRGRVLRAEPIDEPDALRVHELIGREVVEVGGEHRGTVVAVQVNPASDLLVLDGDRLVPIDFLVDASGPGPLVIDPPEGLFDL